MSSLVHCIYASTATVPFGQDELRELLGKARASNLREGITGMLVYADGSFFQVVEGAPDAVARVLAKIGADPRHRQITRIIEEPIAHRSFADWTMGYAHMHRSDIEAVEGLNDFFERASCLATIDAGRARKLLQSFASGRWRATVRVPRRETVAA